MNELGLPELAIIAAIVLFVSSGRLQTTGSLRERAEVTFNKRFFVIIGAVLTVFALAQYFLWWN